MSIFDLVEKKAKEKGIRITRLEATAGMSKGSIGKWRKVSPTVAKLQAVAKVLEVPIADLIPEEK